MIDLKIADDKSDLAWKDGDLVLAEGAEAVECFVWLAFQTWDGDWFMDRREGVHYRTRILGKASRAVSQAEVRRVGGGIPGLVSISAGNFEVDAATRQVTADFEIRTEFDQAARSLRLDPAPVPAVPGEIEDGYYVGGVLIDVPDGYWVDGVNTGEPDIAEPSGDI